MTATEMMSVGCVVASPLLRYVSTISSYSPEDWRFSGGVEHLDQLGIHALVDGEAVLSAELGFADQAEARSLLDAVREHGKSSK